MQLRPRIPEINQRDRFIRKAAAQRLVYAVAGEDGLARVPSQRQRGRDVTLLWTDGKAAERWADVITDKPRIKEIPIDGLINDVLPALERMKRLAGPDWGSEPIEPEMDAGDLADRLKRELVDGFVERVALSRKVYLLEDTSGPALVVSATRSDRLVLPVWSARSHADRRIEGPWEQMLSVEVALDSFLSRKLLWVEDRGWLVAPDHIFGPGGSEIAPADLRARFKP